MGVPQGALQAFGHGGHRVFSGLRIGLPVGGADQPFDIGQGAAHFFDFAGGIEQLGGDQLHGFGKARLIAAKPGIRQPGKAFFFMAGQAAGQRLQQDGVLYPAFCKAVEPEHFGIQAQGARLSAAPRDGNFSVGFCAACSVDQQQR